MKRKPVEPFFVTRYVNDDFNITSDLLQRAQPAQVFLWPTKNPETLRLDIMVSDAQESVRPGTLVRRKAPPHIHGYVVRWPKDRDWSPSGDASDEWVVCWFYADGPQEDLDCAGDFDVIGYLPNPGS